MTPEARTLERIRKLGGLEAQVTYFHAYTKHRRDIWGWIDVFAFSKVGLVTGINATTHDNKVARVKKLENLIAAAAASEKPPEDNAERKAWENGRKLYRFARVGHSLEVWGWALRGPAGKRKLWSVRRTVCVPAAGTVTSHALALGTSL